MIWTKATRKLVYIKEQVTATKASSSPRPLLLARCPLENMEYQWPVLHSDNEQQLTAALCEPKRMANWQPVNGTEVDSSPRKDNSAELLWSSTTASLHFWHISPYRVPFTKTKLLNV
jgi:hypothetical protein